ncbi:hypothetical protein NEOLEDRAFT_1175733 [Neolentinus lepideus HHB14362 ss-1]|uniref:Uncharacterized protein n=1 Tax=Neolentinus lepideus HHB14362 ss-1 TaxID=1314782 RepID=A0A165UMR0_9AGAM|nr:hypothetical protein NEOLEDRAFT_1175733 [Neolentinus lepideus HHB14362 ss-1]
MRVWMQTEARNATHQDFDFKRFQERLDVHLDQSDQLDRPLHSHFCESKQDRVLAYEEGLRDIKDAATGISRISDAVFIGFAIRPEYNPTQKLESEKIRVDVIKTWQWDMDPQWQDVIDEITDILQRKVGMPHVAGYRSRAGHIIPPSGYMLEDGSSGCVVEIDVGRSTQLDPPEVDELPCTRCEPSRTHSVTVSTTATQSSQGQQVQRNVPVTPPTPRPTHTVISAGTQTGHSLTRPATPVRTAPSHRPASESVSNQSALRLDPGPSSRPACELYPKLPSLSVSSPGTPRSPVAPRSPGTPCPPAAPHSPGTPRPPAAPRLASAPLPDSPHPLSAIIDIPSDEEDNASDHRNRVHSEHSSRAAQDLDDVPPPPYYSAVSVTDFNFAPDVISFLIERDIDIHSLACIDRVLDCHFEDWRQGFQDAGLTEMDATSLVDLVYGSLDEDQKALIEASTGHGQV